MIANVVKLTNHTESLVGAPWPPATTATFWVATFAIIGLTILGCVRMYWDRH